MEIKDVALPESMKRSMSRQAEAERERRSRIITADGEFQASRKLASAANVMATSPAALQLRLLQTIVEVAAEKNSTVVLPFPVELLRFLEHATTPPETRPATDRKTTWTGETPTYARQPMPSHPHHVKNRHTHRATAAPMTPAGSADTSNPNPG